MFLSLQIPATEDEWSKLAADFFIKWNFPNAIAAMDGKHILIRPPPSTGSYYFNYKGTHSVVMLALCNANYEFLYVDVGVNGRVSDGGVWKNCTLKKLMENPINSLKIPKSAKLPNSNKILPYIILADDAFPLQHNIMKPFSFRSQSSRERIFSYRLSRGRRVIENAFGIMSSKFRIFQSPINLSPDKVELIVLACAAMHNLLRRECSHDYTSVRSLDAEDEATGLITPGSWRDEYELPGLQPVPGRQNSEGKYVRERFMEHFNDEGAVPWQNSSIGQ